MQKTMFLRGKAKLKLAATIEALDFTHANRLNKAEILRLASCDFIRKFQNLLITGRVLPVGMLYKSKELYTRANLDSRPQGLNLFFG
ncbi:MAG: ATP-binding protein [Candidatus Cloacimonetes bacterium]|nr:ATP-binding protein [Candidatus Cloacimonadota bacterium]